MALNFTDKNPSFFKCAKWDQILVIDYSKSVKSSYLWSCILNSVLAVHTSILNFLIVLLYFKDRRLQTTSNVLILALALSDLFVALVTQPAAIVNNALKLNEIHSCTSELVAFSFTEFGVGLSCCTVCFIVTIERLLVIRWPLKHRVFVTKSILKRVLFVLTLLCLIVLSVAQNASLKVLIALQTGSILSGAIFMLGAYLRIFVVIHNRSKTVGKTYTTRSWENVSQSSKSPYNVSQDSKGNSNSPEDISEDLKRKIHSLKYVYRHSKQSQESLKNVFQSSRHEINLPQNVSQDSKHSNSLKNASQNSKYKINSPKNLSKDSKHNNSPWNVYRSSVCEMNSPNDVTHDSKCKRNMTQNISGTSIREFNPLSNVSQSSNGNDGELPKRKLKDNQCVLSACAALSKAMLNLKQEFRVCKTMAVISGAFVVCFIPRVVIFLCTLTGVISWQTLYNYLGPWIDVLAYANSSLNPYIYFFHNKDISKGVKKIVFGKNNTQLNNTRLPLQVEIT